MASAGILCPFAAGGWTLVGLDYTPAYLQRACSKTADLTARFVQGDMRCLPFATAAFDGLINLFTSFGYFGSDATDQAVLQEMGRVLQQTDYCFWIFKISFVLARNFQERAWSPIHNGFLLEERSWNCRSGKIDAIWTYLRAGEPPRSFETSVRLYSCTELERMLRLAGFAVEAQWGGWDGSALDSTVVG